MFGLELKDLLTLIGLALAAVGLIFTGFQIRLNTRLQRARFIMDVINLYFGDKDVRKAFYAIDYNQFSFDENKIVLSDEEQYVDRLLYTLDLIGRIVDLGALTPRELDVLAFQVLRVMDNGEIQKYLKWLASEYKGRSHVTPHHDAEFLAEQLRKALKEKSVGKA